LQNAKIRMTDTTEGVASFFARILAKPGGRMHKSAVCHFNPINHGRWQFLISAMLKLPLFFTNVEKQWGGKRFT
jgi:hypothetical protein